MNRCSSIIVFFVAAGFVLSGTAAAKTPLPEATVATIDHGLSATLKARITPSVSVAIVQHGRVAYDRTSGDATPTTAYVIGSVTKMFTAVSIMQLVERGKLSLQTPLATYFPEFPSARRITVRDLLAHRSGISNYLDAAVQQGKVYTPTTATAIASAAAKRPLDFAPGTQWSYSNTGYVLLGLIVQRVSGEPLAQYERAHIFIPAGMTQTAVGHAAAGTTLAPPSAPHTLKPVRADNLSWYFGCGDIVSTARDLARFDIALMGGKLLAPATFALMQRPIAHNTLLPGLDDGLGLFGINVGPIRLTGHHGGLPGYRSDNEMIVSDDAAIIVLGNGVFNTNVALNAALEALYPRAVSEAKTAKPVMQTDPDPGILMRALATARDLMHGKVDRAQFTARANAALTDAVATAAAKGLAPLGALEKLTFVQSMLQDGQRFFVYDAVFSNKPQGLRLELSIDSAGKFDVFLIH